jgi:pimeloyl-ACP methyl ester carboxylesterase
MQKLLKKNLPLIYGAYFNGLSYFSKSLAAKNAFDTFCKVRKGKVLPHQASFLDQAKKEKEFVEGHEIQSYHWEGPGATVLLVHGWESNSFRWRNLIRYLRENEFNILAFDAPAHGYSSGEYLHVPLYSECMLHMLRKHRPAHVVAHSVGGMTTLYTQYRYPENSVEKIVTIGAPSEFHEIMEHFRRLLNLNPRVMQALDELVMDRFGFRVREFSASAFARTIDRKGLIFHDKLDTIAPFHASEQVHSQWHGSILVSTEGLGHSMHQDTVNKKIVDFLIS